MITDQQRPFKCGTKARFSPSISQVQRANTAKKMCNPVAAARTHLASKHKRQRPVAADDLTLAHDRRETLKILDRQRHQSRDGRQTDSTRAQLVAPPLRSFIGALLPGPAQRWRRRDLTAAASCSWFRWYQPASTASARCHTEPCW